MRFLASGGRFNISLAANSELPDPGHIVMTESFLYLRALAKFRDQRPRESVVYTVVCQALPWEFTWMKPCI